MQPELNINIENARALYLQIRRVEAELEALRRLAERVIPAEMRDEILFEQQFPQEIVYHIVPKSYYESIPSDQPYLPEPYAQDGFIHCTRGADLMVSVANRYYRSVSGEFLMLAINVRALAAPLKYEALDPAVPFPFPHIYGPLNRGAIIAVMPMKRAKDGSFLVPPLMDQD